MALARRPRASTLPRRMAAASAKPGPPTTGWPPPGPHPGRYDPNNPPRVFPESEYPYWGYGLVGLPNPPRASVQPTEGLSVRPNVRPAGQFNPPNPPKPNRPQIPPTPANPPRPPLGSSAALASKPTLTVPQGPNAPNRNAPAGFHVNQAGETVPNRGRQGETQEQSAFDRYWGNRNEANPYAQMGGLEEVVQQLMARGVTPEQLRGLFSEGVQNLFAPNAAGGQGQPSPYLAYFQQNPQALLELLNTQGIRGYGRPAPGQPTGAVSQEALFQQFPGMRESYLSSLGLKDVNGRIVDPRNPRLTPYQAEQQLGARGQATPAATGATTPTTPTGLPVEGAVTPTTSGYVPSSQGGFGPDLPGTTPAAAATDPILAESQAFVARAQQAANEISAQLQNLPLDPQFTAQRRILEDQLQQNLQIVQNGATNLAAQRRLAQARLTTEQEQDVQALKDALAGRGTLTSSNQFETGLGEMATEYQRIAQDLNADIASALEELYSRGTESLSDYEMGLLDALRESAERIAADDFTPVSEGPTRPRTRPRKNKPRNKPKK